MDRWAQLNKKIKVHMFLYMLLVSAVVAAVSIALIVFTSHNPLLVGAVIFATGIITPLILASTLARDTLLPMTMLSQAIMHMSADGNDKVPAPDLTKLKVGNELVSELIAKVYQYASQQDGQALASHRSQVIQATNIVSHLPLPLFVFNKSQMVVNASIAALEYCQVQSSDLFGKPLYDSINMEFSSERTLEAWIQECQGSKVTDTAYWQRVRVKLPDASMHQCDMAAYYNKDNPSGTEFIVTLFDRTEQYNHEDQDLSFVSLAVHELRTPLTMLRGYIEVFEDELEGKLNPELADFMHKMKISASQLGTFFNNILNVARVEQDQLELHLTEGKWPEILQAACAELSLKAQIHGKKLHVVAAPDLPAVGVDKVSIIEVINNLVDNAIKYGKTNDTIEIAAKMGESGLIETTVQDHGQGVPTGVLPHLFEKFYRNHRTSAQVGGTGLGLYLSRAIVKAHGGEIWVNSKEGEGAVVGFSLVPYARLAEQLKNSDNKEITRDAHGWIKNHSLYRR